MAQTNGIDTANTNTATQQSGTTSTKPAIVPGERIDLFAYTEDELLQDHTLTYYQILNVPEYASQDDIKKAYRRTSLRYHPDKSGRGEEDYVFLAVKQAYDTLLDHAKRQAYDSTVVPFDDHIPPNRATLLQDPLLLYKDDDFYETFEPVFLRNLRFDLRMRPDLNKKNGRNNNNNTKPQPPPSLGNADTPLAQVHAFYEYWTHFESWRDFSATAAEELQVSEHELENAESRHEKRWYQNQIDKRAKQLKRQEVSRIATLVERAMEADPRLRQERADKVRQKEEAAAERQRQKDWEQTQRLQELERQRELEKQQAELAALEKVEREKDKKILRKARQQLRKMASASFESHTNSNPESPSTSPSSSFNSKHKSNSNNNNNMQNVDNSSSLLWDDAYDMQQDVELLCANLSLHDLHELSSQVLQAQQSVSGDCLKLIHERAILARQQQQEEELLQQSAAATLSEESVKLNDSNSNRSRSWSREEVSALAKAVKKYPAGGASRWDQICLWVNNLCRQDIPRTKEECIEQYNRVARGSVGSGNKNNNSSSSSEPVTTTGGDSTTTKMGTTTDSPAGGDGNTDHTSADIWSQAQDQQLQDALARFPATMEKNERWSAIAAAVPGKNKKLCVARFKTIREALKKNKE